MKKKERRPEEPGSQWISAMCEVLKGGVLAGVTAILTLLACAVLVSVGVLPVGGMYGAVLAVCVLGALTGGIFAVRKVGSWPLPAGLGVGLVLFLLLLKDEEVLQLLHSARKELKEAERHDAA